jgi:hypothetical protein
MPDIPQVLNLINLAKGSAPSSQVPGTQLEVLVLNSSQNLTLDKPLWILVLEGEVIIDLPFGDFRVLKQGESLHLPVGLNVTMQPLKEAVVLRHSM